MNENFTVSAIKFRPRTFSEMVGQQHIVRTLTNALSNGKVAHAYLFCGTRGVGKTTTARILAKALNCKDGPTSTPCLECDNCKEIWEGSSLDVMEIDGASNRGIDSIRELRENARFTPTKSRYKVYIIDEVHQITKEAFNALLKTLEEPPDHVVFIFATTESGKVPDTILSRCQSFDYRPISQGDIADQLAKIANILGVDADEPALRLLSVQARGSMRDAQSLFDQCSAYGNGTIKAEDVEMVLGMSDRKILIDCFDAVVQGDAARLLSALARSAADGAEPAIFADELLEIIRNITVMKYDPEGVVRNIGEETAKLLEPFSKSVDIDDLQRYFEIVADTIERMRRSNQTSIVLEMGLLKLVEGSVVTSIDELLENVEKATAKIENDLVNKGNFNVRADPSYIAKPSAEVRPLETNEISGESLAEPDIPADEPVSADFEIVDSQKEHTPSALMAIFANVKPSSKHIFDHASSHISESAVVLVVKNSFELEDLLAPDLKAKLEQRASEYMGRKMRLVVQLEKKGEERNKKADSKKNRAVHDNLLKQISDTAIVQSAMEIFDGELVDMKIDKNRKG